MQVLIVEDELAACRGLAGMLQRFGVKKENLFVASDGMEGLSQLSVHRPDIAFVDIRLNKMSGLEMIQCARTQKLDTTFVLTSAYCEFEYAKEAVHLGVKEYLVKPIAPDDVAAIIAPFFTVEDTPESRVCHPMVQRMLSIIDRDYDKPLNLTTISAELNLTPEYLSYLFRRDMGVNFSTYLRTKRVERALEMMQSGTTRVYDIARTVGFSDPKYFCRVFREVTGLSPGSYLKEELNQPE